MDDTISRKMAIDALHKTMLEFFQTNDDDEQEFITASERMLLSVNKAISNVLKTLPSAQPEVVRCNDCKWYDLTYPCGTIVLDAFHCKINGRFFEASHFCGYGERREDG